ncbi:hypothetical protein Daus18300_004161 [Diaporthe australafricana]|uniref:Uncharacterized protein n=1 Tax=Diaporthe australafricana TaxID=127596 RepID=A0ABR3XB14_9PEZI
MDRNGTFDHRNFIYPVQIYPVSGDPRFPFHFSSGPPNINMSESVLPPSRHGITTVDETTPDQRDAADPPGSMVAKRDTSAAAAADMLEYIVQGLSHQLDKAIKFYEESLQSHKETMILVKHASYETRNILWKEFLEARLERSRAHKDLLQSLVPHARRTTQQALRAATNRPDDGSDSPEDKDWHDKMVLRVNRLSAECICIDGLSRKALSNTVACEDMVEVMTQMKALCGQITASREATPEEGQEGGQDGGDKQY